MQKYTDKELYRLTTPHYTGYRGEIMGKFKVTTDAVPTVYQPGEAFGQLVIVPIQILDPVFVEELSETERGTMGFGEADERVEEAA